MVKYMKGDLLASDCTIICHQTNCQGVLDSGIAKQIRNTYPLAYTVLLHRFEDGEARLGTVDIVSAPTKEERPRFVVNMYAQNRYLPRGITHTNYKAFTRCIRRIKYIFRNKNHWKIGFPTKIGCGLAGGDWEVVKGIIEKEFADPRWNVEIWEL